MDNAVGTDHSATLGAAMCKYVLPLAIVVSAASIGCGDAMTDATSRLERYATFRLTADLSSLTENQQRMIPILIEAATCFRKKVPGSCGMFCNLRRGGTPKKCRQL